MSLRKCPLERKAEIPKDVDGIERWFESEHRRFLRKYGIFQVVDILTKYEEVEHLFFEGSLILFFQSCMNCNCTDCQRVVGIVQNRVADDLHEEFYRFMAQKETPYFSTNVEKVNENYHMLMKEKKIKALSVSQQLP